MRPVVRGVLLLFLVASALDSFANAPTKGPEIQIRRASGPISVDGDLSDPGWQGAMRVDTWFETNPGDNIPAKVKNVALLAYDDKFLYAGFQFDDPDASKIRAYFGEHDNLGGHTDYGGLILDSKGDGKTATLFLANARGLRYDAVSDDSNGSEDSSPDFYWDALGRITDKGWQLEIRIPFSSLRYPKADLQHWNILLYRNYPRDFRVQMFSAKLPRDENCFICHLNPLEGLTGLPAGGTVIAAPYLTAKQEAFPGEGPGSPLVSEPIKIDAGLDVKWTPNAVTALDATINPDFSQVESDVAQISANERFALFYPEKRPFFLEGIELFSSPIQAVYTRTITSPRWGLRGTGKLGTTSYTALVSDDRGGGSVILPGPNGSDLADQDFKSLVAIGRVRHDIGNSFVSLLVTDREINGGGNNRVIGPDFQWRPTAKDTLTGQILFSWSQTPDRPDLAAEWNGQKLSGHAADVWFNHGDSKWDFFTEYKDVSEEFRADAGYVPQVGYRENFLEGGYTIRPKKGPFSRIRTFLIGDYSAEQDGSVIFKQVSPGVGADGILSSSARIRVGIDEVRAGDKVSPRTQFLYTFQFTPSRAISRISLDGFLGEQVDFAGARPGHGGRVTLAASIRPSNHLELRFDGDLRWLNVRPFEGGEEQRLFTAQVERIKATYTFTSRCYLRVIAQWVQLDQSPELSATPVEARSGSFSASALFGYKLNWQSVLFLGYGDSRTLTEDGRLDKEDRQLFLKVSYAFQL
jgi:hypothetical protein